MIDQEIFLQQMALFADRIGRVLAGPTQLEYYRQLSGALTTEQFVGAMTLAFNSASGAYRNWPSPKELIEMIAPVERPTISAPEAFELVLEIMTTGNQPIAERVAAVQLLGASTVRAFRAAGGVRDFANMLIADVPWARNRFVEAYTAAVEGAESERVATLALNDAGSRVAGLISAVAAQKQLPPLKKVGAG